MITGGQMVYPDLTNSLEEKEYAIAKVCIWMDMLNDRNKPEKWFKSNKNGTRINFKTMHAQEEFEQAVEEITMHIELLNRKYDLNMGVKRSE